MHVPVYAYIHHTRDRERGERKRDGRDQQNLVLLILWKRQKQTARRKQSIITGKGAGAAACKVTVAYQ